MEYNDFDIYWDGHAAVRVVDEGFTVAVDPFDKVSPDFEANLVLVTHDDLGHFDPGKLEDICVSGTCVVIPSSMDEDDIPCSDVEKIDEGDEIDIFGITVEAVPMYNDQHERGEGFGYRFEMRGYSFFVAGDTGLIDEFFDLENRVNVAFLPVEGDYTMDVDDAIQSAVRIKPELVIPYHYGKPFFSDMTVDLKAFQNELEDRNIRCEIIEKEKLD
ncbi:MAG: L-ascorbate metabolism protein UlaG (beta-lactamase superfamily) [Candidatus Nanohaloarchaea archaeon]|jgi:L-ascorbate metabolism protein UlaG (beta-lactamase superfamily)